MPIKPKSTMNFLKKKSNGYLDLMEQNSKINKSMKTHMQDNNFLSEYKMIEKDKKGKCKKDTTIYTFKTRK